MCPRVPLADINGDSNSGDVACTSETRDFAYYRGIAQLVQGAGRAAARLRSLGWGRPGLVPNTPTSRHSGLCMVDYRLRRAWDDPTPTHPPSGKKPLEGATLGRTLPWLHQAIIPRPIDQTLSPPSHLFLAISSPSHPHSFSITNRDVVATFPSPPSRRRVIFYFGPYYYCIAGARPLLHPRPRPRPVDRPYLPVTYLLDLLRIIVVSVRPAFAATRQRTVIGPRHGSGQSRLAVAI